MRRTGARLCWFFAAKTIVATFHIFFHRKNSFASSKMPPKREKSRASGKRIAADCR
jgi:hypothetical protein